MFAHDCGFCSQSLKVHWEGIRRGSAIMACMNWGICKKNKKNKQNLFENNTNLKLSPRCVIRTTCCLFVLINLPLWNIYGKLSLNYPLRCCLLLESHFGIHPAFYLAPTFITAVITVSVNVKQWNKIWIKLGSALQHRGCNTGKTWTHYTHLVCW